MSQVMDQWSERLAVEAAKIAQMPSGSVYTLAFLGIRSGLAAAEKTRTAQALGYSGQFHLDKVDFSRNATLPPNPSAATA